MELQDHIRLWFQEGCHFGTGVGLLQQTQRYPADALRFRSYFSAHFIPPEAEKQLRQLLKLYLESQPVADVVTENPTNVANSVIVRAAKDSEYSVDEINRIISKVTLGEREELKTLVEPVEIQKLRETAKEWHKKQSYVHAQMGMVQSDEERYACAAELMEEIIPTLDRIYDQIRAYEKDGTLPAPAAVDDIARATLKKYIHMDKTLRPRISRLKKFIRTGKNAKGRQLSGVEITNYKKELTEKELEVAELMEELSEVLD